ncbi:MAG TPA: DUF2058 family protein [Candidatus Hydrogenedentes bacterium]|nr:DUF2058 family protein [Candidatus Hydrogenedentota bacterium]HPG69649.1 DUF2058 family protein [Candidatus Hydrogenedentota bacterium]
MGDLLRQQLLKKGLATKKQVKAAETVLRQQAAETRKAQQAGETVETEQDAVAELAAKAHAEKAARDQALNEARELERAEREAEAQVRDLIRRHRIEVSRGNVAYHFAHGKTVKALDVTEDTQRDLREGHLAIAFLDGKYEFVTADVAYRILDRMPEAIVCLHDEPDAFEDSDEGADPE